MTWGEIYALMCAETGWTWEYVDEEMTLPRLDEFTKLWNRHPPLRVAVHAIAIALGMENSTPAVKKKPDLGAYIEGFAGAGLTVERVRHG